MDVPLPPSFGELPSSVDISLPNPARIYDYLLGGNHNFAIDRETADRAMAAGQVNALPAMANRSFLRRAVRFMVDQGVTQFLDLGSGIPTVGNVHEIAQHADPAARVVYVDNEPVAVAHARRLLTDNPNATMVAADLRDTEYVLAHPETSQLLDFSRPVGVLMVAVFHFIPDAANPGGIIRDYLAALKSGGFLALSHYTQDGYTPEKRELARAGLAAYASTQTQVVPRSRADLTALLGGLEMVPPGCVYAPLWHPDNEPVIVTDPSEAEIYAVVARIPG
ncbi:MAG TPA: SAM-dependent methyltransferase [Pseudonocardiaceae bacterium]